MKYILYMVSRFLLLLYIYSILCNEDLKTKDISRGDQINNENGMTGANQNTVNFPIDDQIEDKNTFNSILFNLISQAGLSEASTLSKSDLRNIIKLLIEKEIQTFDTKYQNEILENVLSVIPEHIEIETITEFISSETLINSINNLNKIRSTSNKKQDNSTLESVANLNEESNNVIKETLIDSNSKGTFDDNLHSKDDL